MPPGAQPPRALMPQAPPPLAAPLLHALLLPRALLLPGMRSSGTLAICRLHHQRRLSSNAAVVAIACRPPLLSSLVCHCHRCGHSHHSPTVLPLVPTASCRRRHHSSEATSIVTAIASCPPLQSSHFCGSRPLLSEAAVVTYPQHPQSSVISPTSTKLIVA